MTSPSISVTVEGNSDEALARKLLELAEFTVSYVYVQGGKDRLDEKLRAFNHAAKFTPWFVLRDLDQDAPCAPDLVKELLPDRAVNMCFRIPVRTAESWLLADRKNISQFLGVPMSKIGANPDDLDDPKTVLINLARKSKSKQIREDIVPPTNAVARVGPAYVSRIIEFSNEYWDPRKASKNSKSLAKCLLALEKLNQALTSKT